MGHFRLAASVFLAAAFLPVYFRWSAHNTSGLAPVGGGVLKDLAAQLLCTIPAITRAFKPVPTPTSLEGFHENLPWNTLGEAGRLKDSPFFAENFYFWANARPGDDPFVLTTRLSFYGTNASTVIPWFHVFIGGERWNLPPDFEGLVPPHAGGSEMVAQCKHGVLRFVCDVPLERWRLTYEGTLENLATGELRQASGEFVLTLRPKNVFMYQIHWNELTAARAMAGKPWTAAFWRNLRAQNQERYASLGEVDGSFALEGGGEWKGLKLDGSRDHNFGIRDWKFINPGYIWWPPIKFQEPLVMEGKSYTYLTGAMTEYGNTMQNAVVAGLMTEDGECAAVSGATPMTEIAPVWFHAETEVGVGIGRRTVPLEFGFEFGLLDAQYVLGIQVRRGHGAGNWDHSFFMQGGEFEVHEAFTEWAFELRRAGGDEVVGTATAVGLLEFGADLLRLPQSHYEYEM